MSKRTVVVVTSDHHCGHPAALFPADIGWELEGGHVTANDWQVIVWEHWLSAWQHIGDLRRGARLIVFEAGDPVEGVHHGNVQLLTQRIDEQERMHVACMQRGLQLAGWKRRTDVLRYIAGTEAHGGPANRSAERIVRTLLDVDADEVREGALLSSRFVGRINGVLFDVAHDGLGVGGREWTRDNTMRAYLTSRWLECGKRGELMPRYVVRGHRHRYRVADLRDDQGQIVCEALITPAWKLKDEYIYQRHSDAINTIGLLVWVIEADGAHRWLPWLMRVDQEAPVEEL